jgi:S-adenosylmethionine:tRNA ribosyltransferase-isomerase
MPLSLADFDYDLPPELIAQFPLPERTGSRLLVVDGGKLEDRRFSEITQLLREGDLLVFNDTRVLHARLHGVKDSGGRVEVLIERPVGKHEALAQIRASHAPWPGSRLVLEGVLEVSVVAREGAFFLLRFPGTDDLVDLLERHGKLPLPPYIQRQAENADEARYQTVYARERGSVAAPTAGLHFDAALMEALRAKGVDFAWLTLHVGAGTFQPVRVEDLAHHRMHRERYIIPADTVNALSAARTRGGRIVAVGTTSLRALEAAAQEGEILPGPGETELFILPGFRFRTADALITNFHLPKSTLLMLVSAFGGLENVRQAYRHALAERYRFFSYGDAMFLHKNHEI